MEVMDDPVMDQCAHNFERRAIIDWLQQQQQQRRSRDCHSSCCPISRKPLIESDLIPNHTLAERIERWKWQKEDCAVDWEETGREVHRPNAETQQEQPSPTGVDEKNNSITVDTDDDDDESDVESGRRDRNHRKVKRFGKGRFMKRKQQEQRGRHPVERYESLPKVDLMLLPQERVMLEKVRVQNETDKLIAWRKKCYMTMLICMIVLISVVLLSMALYTRLQSNDAEVDDEN
jgi:U-box domain